MEKQEEPISTGERVEEAETGKKRQSLWDIVKEFLLIIPYGLGAFYRTVYPNWVRKLKWQTQVLIYVVIFTAIFGTAWFAWSFFIGKLVWVIGGAAVACFGWVLWFHTEIPEVIWHAICWPFVWLKDFFFGRWWRTMLTVLLVFPLLFIARGTYQPYITSLVEHVANIVVMANLVLLMVFVFGKKWIGATVSRAGIAVNVLVFVLIQYFGLVDVVSYRERYKDLEIVKITEKFPTPKDYWHSEETIDNLVSRHKKTDHYLTPADLMLSTEGELRYTVGMTPKSWITKLFSPYKYGGVIETGTGKEKKDTTSRFQVEKSLYHILGSEGAIIRNLGPWQFFTTKVSNTLRLPGPQGEKYLVTIVDQLVNFPNAYYVPAGVYIVKAGDNMPLWKLALFGTGTYVPLSETHKYPFLKGQSLVSNRSLEQLGNSGRYLAGYADGAWIKRKGVFVDKMHDGEMIENIVYAEGEAKVEVPDGVEVKGEAEKVKIKGLTAMLPMVGLENPETQMRTWYVELSDNRNRVYEYNNSELDPRSAPSELSASLFDSLDDKSLSTDEYTIVQIHSTVKEVDGKMIEGYMSTIAKLDENGNVTDKNVIKVLTVIVGAGEVNSARYRKGVSLEDQIRELLKT